MASSAAANSGISRIVIDTDCGADDAAALVLAVLMRRKDPNLRIEAITTVCGNVDLDKVRPNVLRVLTHLKATDIPVYDGAAAPLLEPHRDATKFHGTDGFGDVAHKYPFAEIPAPEEHAVNALIRLARQHRGQISLIALGPLTNIALAIRMDAAFLDNLKEVVVMGGAANGSGNHTPGSEFNFGCDPEAMAVLVNETKVADKLIIVPYDVCQQYTLDFAWLKRLDRTNAAVGLFTDVMARGFERWAKAGRTGACIYDMFTTAVHFDRALITASVVCPVYPILSGKWSRGGTVMDRRSSAFWEKTPNATVVTGLDVERLKAMLEDLFKLGN